MKQLSLEPCYKNASQSIDSRVDDLIAHMTLDEKIAQMCCIWDDKRSHLCNEMGEIDVEKALTKLPYGIGQIARPSDTYRNGILVSRDAVEMAEFTNKVQRFFIERTRLGIPVLFHEECLHGHMAKGGTSFPVPIALSCSWDIELIEEIFEEIAEEVRCRGGHQVLTPVVDVAREPRWGRFEETFGEDPYLAGEMASAVVNGLQGRVKPDEKIDNAHVGATLKHFAGHGQPESGINAAPGNFTPRNLREIVLSPFRKCIENAHPVSVMASYNEIDGVPSHANAWLLRDILRNEWGFKGFVVADYYGIQQLYERHHVADGPMNAALAAFLAGVDIEFPDQHCFPYLKDLVNKEVVAIEAIDKSVRKLLTVKFRLGLFDNPYVDSGKAKSVTGSAKKRTLAQIAAQKSIVLLKNDNDLLPLNLSRYKAIGVIGPNTDKILLGGYSGEPLSSVTLLDGIRELAGDQCTIVHSEGCRITEPGKWIDDLVRLPDPQEEIIRLAEAYDKALTCDIIILALGGNEQISREAWSESHAGDCAHLDLIGNQGELVRQILQIGKPVVVTLFHGRPQSIPFIAENVPAILDCWYLGQEAGLAVADVLFGKCSPGGKLTVSIPRSVGHIPSFYNYKPTARQGYLFDDVTPLFPFGFGLSYTTFNFGEPKLVDSEIRPGQSTTVSVDVSNTGTMIGTEVVQMYIRDCVSSVTRPVKELKGFCRISLKPGESRTVTLAITPDALGFYDLRMKFTVEPGEFEIMIGNSSKDSDLKKIKLLVIP